MKKAINLLVLISAGVFLSGYSNAFPLSKSSSIRCEANSKTYEECLEAANYIDLNVDTSRVVTSVRLPCSGLYSSVITWVSSDTSIIEIKQTFSDSGVLKDTIGKVIRPEDTDKDVLLTAKIVIGDDASSAATKEFKVTVLKKTKTESTQALEFSEDFSSYAKNIDLSNYYSWQLNNGENCAQAVSEIPGNINNNVSSSMLEISSGKASSDSYYDAKTNITENAVMEGYLLYTGQTNGVSIDLLTSSSAKAASITISSSSFAYFQSGAERSISSTYPSEGVWVKFRIVLDVKNGYYYAGLYDWNNQESLIDVTPKGNLVSLGILGVAGASGTITTLRIRAHKGINIGKTYISDLKIGKTADMAQAAGVNPNRTDGLGIIEGYDSSILSVKTKPADPLNQSFIVHNRFDYSQVYTKSSDYTISYTETSSADGMTIYIKYMLKLLASGETKEVNQTVYYDYDDNTAAISSFKVSYLKAVGTSISPTKGTIDISGTVIRSDSVITYAVLEKGSGNPSADALISNPGGIQGVADYGTVAQTSRNILITTNQLDLYSDAAAQTSKEYDVYAITHNANGNSPLYSAVDVSTLVNISTCDDFYDMTVNIMTASSKFRLINDIDFSNYNWNFDASSSLKFLGSLDGQGFTVSNLEFSSPTEKVALFFNFGGSIENLYFEDCTVKGADDVGIIAANMYGGTLFNVRFDNCTVGYDTTSSTSAGYFGIVAGRMRGTNASYSFDDISIMDCAVQGPKYLGLMTGGIEKTNTATINNIEGIGTLESDGAALGLIGRNRGTTTITNGLCFLDIINAKKEVGVVAGHNKEGGKLSITNFIGKLKIEAITQTAYFNNFIGSHDSNTSSYSATNSYFFNEDYSQLSDLITADVKAITIGTLINEPDEYTQKWWETSTCFADLDISADWKYDPIKKLPVICLRDPSSIFFTAEQFNSYVNQINPVFTIDNHYYIYKAEDMLDYMTDTEKAKAEISKLDTAKAQYEAMLTLISSIYGDLGSLTSGGK
jgi:hypothetical protein